MVGQTRGDREALQRGCVFFGKVVRARRELVRVVMMMSDRMDDDVIL